MIDLNTKLARAAWELGPISKSMVPEHMLNELISDFEKNHSDVTIKSVEEVEQLNTYSVTIVADERLDLYSEWMSSFEAHGYEAPFLVFEHPEGD